MRKLLAICISGSLLLAGCHPKSCLLEPNIVYCPNKNLVTKLPSAFPKLTLEESNTEWGKEMKIGLAFAMEMDFYRAITALKRALFLIPQKNTDRILQIEYSIMQCYYIGGKCASALEAFNASHLPCVTSSFPAYKDLRLMLYDCYQRTGDDEHAEHIYNLIEQTDPETAKDLDLSAAFLLGNLGQIKELSANGPNADNLEQFVSEYCSASKSAEKAQTLSAILPGAGYYYVGQKKAAVTSFLVNAIFIWAAWNFFEKGNVAAGIFTASLESGWYLGGINGAGLAAKEYNQQLYEVNASQIMVRDKLFPMLMLHTTF